MEIIVNNNIYTINADPNMPLLWVLRDLLGFTGTKYGCGIGYCKTCTVLIDGVAEQSCIIPVGNIGKKKITTIEGLSQNGEHPLQKAWIELSVSQCGYCQPGQLIAASELIANNPKPTIEDINNHMSGHICRCGTYPKIREAIILATKE